jgi:hypothetical protein
VKWLEGPKWSPLKHSLTNHARMCYTLSRSKRRYLKVNWTAVWRVIQKAAPIVGKVLVFAYQFEVAKHAQELAAAQVGPKP